jgi:hypothetical protein
METTAPEGLLTVSVPVVVTAPLNVTEAVEELFTVRLLNVNGPPDTDWALFPRNATVPPVVVHVPELVTLPYMFSVLLLVSVTDVPVVIEMLCAFAVAEIVG